MGIDSDLPENAKILGQLKGEERILAAILLVANYRHRKTPYHPADAAKQRELDEENRTKKAAHLVLAADEGLVPNTNEVDRMTDKALPLLISKLDIIHFRMLSLAYDKEVESIIEAGEKITGKMI